TRGPPLRSWTAFAIPCWHPLRRILRKMACYTFSIENQSVVVPENLRAWLLRMHHHAPLAAHQGHKRMIQQLVPRFFGPGMVKDIIRWVQGCIACRKRKTPRPLRQGITMPIQSSFPNQTVAIDIVGPMMESSSGNRWILTMIDVFTRWP